MDHFVVIEKIGNGAFGEVFKARNTVTGDLVAIKKLRLADDGQLRVLPAALFQEIETLRQCDHINVVKLHEVFADGTNVALAMEFVEFDLFSILRHRQRDFSDPEIRCIMRKLLLAVQYCHDHRIIHRDIKPGNLLVTADGELKLTDFGLATIYIGPSKSYSHQVATRWYRAPELLFGSRHYDTAIDMWAVGAIFAELLHLVPVFPGQSDIDQLFRIFQVLGSPEKSWPAVSTLPDYNKVQFPVYEPLPWRQLFPDASIEAVDLLSKLLVLDPTQRLTATQCLHHPFFFSGPTTATIVRPPPRTSPTHDKLLPSLGNPLQAPFA